MPTATGLDPARSRLVSNPIFARPTHRAPHPLAIARVSAATDLARALGWLDATNSLVSEPARPDQVTAFHDPEYFACLARAERDQRVTEAEAARFGLGVEGNSIYPDVYARPMVSVGGTLLACRLALERRIAVHHPGGGTHHARAARASGFCYLNDAVLGLMAWRAQGLARVAYLDIDAHHGDGVELAFADDPQVLTISVHEQGRWPRTGGLDDGAGRTAALNLPLPAGLNDSEMDHAMAATVFPALDAFDPQAIVLQAGADGLLEDPQSGFALSNNAHFRICRQLMRRCVPLVVLGGGGYNPYTVARLWAGLWGCLSGRELDVVLPEPARAVLSGLDWHLAHRRPPDAHTLTRLRDAPREGPIRDDIRRIVQRVRGSITA